MDKKKTANKTKKSDTRKKDRHTNKGQLREIIEGKSMPPYMYIQP